jgi:hypothetical protein
MSLLFIAKQIHCPEAWICYMLFINQLMDIWVTSFHLSRWLWIMLLCIFVHEFLFKYLFQLKKKSRSGITDCMVILPSFYWGTVKLAIPYSIPTSNVKSSSFSIFSVTHFFSIIIIIGVKWQLISGFHCILLMTRNSKLFLCVWY